MNLRTDTLLYATVDGDIEFHSFLRIVEQIADLAAEQRISRILLDAGSLTGDVSVPERIDLAVKFTDYLAMLGIHPSIAAVGQPPIANGLGVLAAQTLGANVQLFPSIQEAMDWLGPAKVCL